MILVKVRLAVVFLIEVQNRTFIFITFDVTIRLVTAINAIIKPIAVPLIRNARLVRHAFELIIVAEFAASFIIAFRTIADVVTS